MRIAIDARKLHDFGIGTYVRNLLRHLARIDQTTEYVVLCRGTDGQLVRELGENFRAVTETSPGYSVREQITIPLALRRERADLFHAPHYVLPPLTRCKTVVTIHDCIHLRFPQYLPNRLGYAYARGFLWTATHQSNRILTVSEASKRDILDYFSVPPEKINVIYNGIDERFSTPPAEDDVARVRERYQLEHPFILYAGNIKPHKNIERTIEAFHLLRRGGQFDHVKLVIIGDEIAKYAALRHAVHRHKLHKHVRFFGFVPDRTLAILYRLAGVFVFPSLYEGFGLPPLEAMASGLPGHHVERLVAAGGRRGRGAPGRPAATRGDCRRHAARPDRRDAQRRPAHPRTRPRPALLVGPFDPPCPRDLQRGAADVSRVPTAAQRTA